MQHYVRVADRLYIRTQLPGGAVYREISLVTLPILNGWTVIGWGKDLALIVLGSWVVVQQFTGHIDASLFA